jgi:hypothetical protein
MFDGIASFAGDAGLADYISIECDRPAFTTKEQCFTQPPLLGDLSQRDRKAKRAWSRHVLGRCEQTALPLSDAKWSLRRFEHTVP